MPAFPYPMEFTEPRWLIGLAAIGLIVLYSRRTLTDFAPRRRRLLLATRGGIVTALVLALAGLTLLTPTREPYVVFAIDRSASTGDASRAVVGSFLKRARDAASGRPAVYLPFAASPGELTADLARAEAAPVIDNQGTNIAAAIDAAASAIPPEFVPRIVLLTDGNQTVGDAAHAALGAGVPIFPVVLETRRDPEVQISTVQVPAQVREGEPFNVDVTIDSNHADEGLIEVYRGEHRVIGERRRLAPGENRFRFRQSITRERLAAFSVRISGLRRDTLLDNNVAGGLVFASGKPRVLCIDSDPQSDQHLAWAMEEEQIQLEVRPPQGAPVSLSDLQNYELLILANVPAEQLTPQQMELVRTYVQDLGGGLLMLGGDQSFGLGGYYKTVLDEILPVRSDFEKEQEHPSLAMVLLIDKSGSMGGEKIELAKIAARSAVELLGPEDKIGVLAFETEPAWVSPMGPAAARGRVLDDISRLSAGGGTALYPALVEAGRALASTVAKLKHVIILTDGASAPADFREIVGSMAATRMTISTVAVGAEADVALLQEIARRGQGRYYFTSDPASVPQIFARETIAAGKSALNEQPFLPQVVRTTQTLADVDFETAPLLLGYVVTRAKPTSELILATETGDPLLAWWRYGLGTTVAFTSDARNQWAAEWLTWPGYSRFWAQVIRHAMRRSGAQGFAVEVTQANGRAAVSVDAVDPAGSYINQADLELTVIDPQLGRRKFAAVQTAPGRYTAGFEATLPGAYHLELVQKENGKVISQLSRGLVVGYPEELRLRPANTALLESIATGTGGVLNPEPEQVFVETNRTTPRPTPLWPCLIATAACLFVLDVAIRRW